MFYHPTITDIPPIGAMGSKLAGSMARISPSSKPLTISMYVLSLRPSSTWRYS